MHGALLLHQPWRCWLNSGMTYPVWFGRRYPSLLDFEHYAESLGAGIGEANIPFGVFLPDVLGVPVILIPRGSSGLERAWFLAHEIGHLVQHAGPRGELLHGKDEGQADKWAARALIPESAVRRHRNASLDAFIAALSRHYEDLPMHDCPQRRLAAKIANIRLKAVEEVA